ncbi:MAG: SAM-dependent methyltransferase [Lachnospiraceae bacterium]|nr:SAM-dependent methyltransferase [Lachnospiraceae bacterium]
MRPVVLSKRLQAVAAMVTAGNSVCDVGCDHGFVPIWLVEQGISPRVLAMDVRSGPLSAASDHIAEHGLESRIETRLSNGLHNYNVGEADTLICAGMGGGLMMRILSEDQDKTASFRELILQPQSEIERFRAGLREMGYRIADEQMIEEDGKFYPMMRIDVELCKLKEENCTDDHGANRIDMAYARNSDIVFGNIVDDSVLCKLEDRYGGLLLRRKDRTLAAYLRREDRIYGEILAKLQTEGLSDVKRERRYTEVSKLRDECRMAIWIVADHPQT